MESALPKLRSIGSARNAITLIRATSCASCSSSSPRSFTSLNRSPPNYPGHVPLTRVERAGLAIGASVMSFFDPYRHGMRFDFLQEPSVSLADHPQTSSLLLAKPQPHHTSSTAFATPCSQIQPAVVSSELDLESPPKPSPSKLYVHCPKIPLAAPT